MFIDFRILDPSFQLCLLLLFSLLWVSNDFNFLSYKSCLFSLSIYIPLFKDQTLNLNLVEFCFLISTINLEYWLITAPHLAYVVIHQCIETFCLFAVDYFHKHQCVCHAWFFPQPKQIMIFNLNYYQQTPCVIKLIKKMSNSYFILACIFT